MRNALDVAKQAIAARTKALGGWCQYYIGLVISAFLGRVAPGGYASAKAAYEASVIYSRNPLDAVAGDVVYFHYPPYGHVAYVVGHNMMVHGSNNRRGLIQDLGGGALLSHISEYATSRPFLGVSKQNGSRPAAAPVAAYVIPSTPVPVPTPGGYTYKMVVGDGLTYQEPTGEWANRLLRGLVAFGLDPKTNSTSDGIIGKNTRKAIQRSVRGYGYLGVIDGKIGKNTIKAVQRRARALGGYPGPIDGIPGINTWNGFAKSLGQ